jgi:hypothetical protein
VSSRGIGLFTDILPNLRDWQICASIDGTGAVGEYIRTGLDYNQWLENFKLGTQIQKHPRQMRIDFTLTLPGLFEVINIQQLADTLGVEILAKVIFSFTPDIVLSPLVLPRHILDRKIDELTQQLSSGALRDILVNLKNRPTFQEQWPDSWQAELIKGKRRILKLEQIRKDCYTLSNILEKDTEMHAWWNNVKTD